MFSWSTVRVASSACWYSLCSSVYRNLTTPITRSNDVVNDTSYQPHGPPQSSSRSSYGHVPSGECHQPFHTVRSKIQCISQRALPLLKCDAPMSGTHALVQLQCCPLNRDLTHHTLSPASKQQYRTYGFIEQTVSMCVCACVTVGMCGRVSAAEGAGVCVTTQGIQISTYQLRNATAIVRRASGSSVISIR